MAQASVLTDNDIRRVFRIIETTRHAERNRLAFALSVYAGLQTKGSKGRPFIAAENSTVPYEHLKFFSGFDGGRQRCSILVGISSPSG